MNEKISLACGCIWVVLCIVFGCMFAGAFGYIMISLINLEGKL